MSEWLNNIRQKPKEVRQRYAFMGAVVTTSMIALLWVSSLPAQLARVEQRVDTGEEESSPTGAFANILKRAKDQMAASFNALQEEASEVEVTVETATTTTAPAVAPDDLVTAALNNRVSTTATTTETPTTTASTTINAAPVMPRTVLIATSAPATTTEAGG